MTPQPWCADPTDVTFPPCLHNTYRSLSIARDVIFPIRFPTLFVLSRLAARVMPTPGNYDGYVLAGTTFIFVAPGTRYIATVYNADANFFGNFSCGCGGAAV